MTLAIFGLVAAWLVSLAGNGARLVSLISARIGPAPQLLLIAVLAQAVIAALLLLAGAALAPSFEPALARIIASALLAVAALLALRPYPVSEPVEPTRSLGAIGLVVAAYAIRDGIAPLALAIGLVAPSLTWPVAGVVFGAGTALAIAQRGVPENVTLYARYLAAIFLAVAAFYLGAFAA